MYPSSELDVLEAEVEVAACVDEREHDPG